MHIIAAKAVAFKEALEPSFITYQKQVIKNAKQLAKTFIELGYNVLTEGTDNHLILVDVKSKHGITGKKAEEALYQANITINKNSLPFDTEKPALTSGIRLGSPAMTTKGYKEKEFDQIARWIDEVLSDINNQENVLKIKKEVLKLTHKMTK
jgi:glycine hydroxymethyltransferase